MRTKWLKLRVIASISTFGYIFSRNNMTAKLNSNHFKYSCKMYAVWSGIHILTTLAISLVNLVKCRVPSKSYKILINDVFNDITGPVMPMPTFLQINKIVMIEVSVACLHNAVVAS